MDQELAAHVPQTAESVLQMVLASVIRATVAISFQRTTQLVQPAMWQTVKRVRTTCAQFVNLDTR